MATESIESLHQHELVILRRLRNGPLTEFELIREITGHSGHTAESAGDNIEAWLTSLRANGLIWMGQLENASGQRIYAAALTRAGRELIK